MSPRTVHFAAVLAALTTGSTALATPPDVDDARLSPLCVGDDGVAWSSTIRGNGGSHYLSTSRWGVLWVAPVAGTIQFESLGGVTENYLDVDRSRADPQKPEVSWQRSTANPVAFLEGWGAHSCSPRNQLALYRTTGAELGWVLREPGGVTLTLANQKRDVAARVVDIRNRASDYRDPTGTVPFDELAPFWLDEETTGFVPGPAIATGKHVVASVRLQSGFDPTDVLVVLQRTDFDRALAWLLNAHGLEQHRAGLYEVSATWFREAITRDPTFSIARFNLACALARLDDIGGVVKTFEDLATEPGIGAKVDADSDFDALRTDPMFIEARGKLK